MITLILQNIYIIIDRYITGLKSVLLITIINFFNTFFCNQNALSSQKIYVANTVITSVVS